MANSIKEETTFYRFYSEVRAFISKILKKPIDAKPNKYLVDRGFGKEKLIKILVKRGILNRSEKITDQTDSDVKRPTYNVKYKLIVSDFESKVHKIYNDYFGKEGKRKNINEMKSFFVNEDDMIEEIKKSPDWEVYEERGGLKECDCGSVCSSGEGLGGDAGGYVPVIGGVMSRPFPTSKPKKKKKKHKKKKKSRKSVYLTESQLRFINDIILTKNLGDELLL